MLRETLLGGIYFPATSPSTAFRSLRQDPSQFGIIFVLIDMVDSNMSTIPSVSGGVSFKVKSTLNARTDPPLKIIWSWIFMLLARAEWAYIPRRIMDEAMPNHFIFALEPPPTRAPRTLFNRAIMGPILRMHIRM